MFFGAEHTGPGRCVQINGKNVSPLEAVQQSNQNLDPAISSCLPYFIEITTIFSWEKIRINT